MLEPDEQEVPAENFGLKKPGSIPVDPENRPKGLLEPEDDD